jgi:hypothetical protein
MTKRQLGYVFITLGFGAIVGLFLLDFIGAGQFQGIGPAQKQAMVAAAVGILLGISLIPFGDKPA